MGGNDPGSPDYNPEYTGGNDNLGDVGSGREFGAHLFYLYRAGRVALPDIAQKYSDYTSEMHTDIGTVEPEIGLASPTGARCLTEIMDLHAMLQMALRTTAVNTRDAGQALVDIAHMFAQTDEAAHAEYVRQLNDNRALLAEPARPIPTPPSPTDPQPPAYDPAGPRIHASEAGSGQS